MSDDKTDLIPDDVLEQYKDKWLEIGLSTETIDVDAAMAALKVAYENVGLVRPDKVEVYASPFEAIDEMKIRYDMDVKTNDFVYGSQDASWLSFYDCIHKELKLECCDILSGLFEFAKHCGWALLYDEMVVLTHKPLFIKMDENDLLHCEDGLAIKYGDGAGVAAWHGTRIPAEWILDKSTLTPKVLLAWENIEQRRCACEIIGWATALELMESVVIDKDEDETIGTLMEVDIPDIGKEKFLVAVDPNVGKRVGLPVPPEMKTALEANSWTYGIDPFDFKPNFRV